MKLTRKFGRFLSIAVLACGSFSAVADELFGDVDLRDDKMPTEDGFSGYIVGGVAVMDIESNLLPGHFVLDVDLKQIGSVFDGPVSDDSPLPAATFEFVYTFAEKQTQIFLGTGVEDLVTFDTGQELGVRRQVDGWGLLSGSVLFKGIAAEAWEDPYEEGTRRADTDRDMLGLRLEWNEIMGTGFGVHYARRQFEFDNERSGEFLVSQGRLTPAEAVLLEREGDDDTLSVSYSHSFNARHTLKPEVGFRNRDRDGDASSGDFTWVELAYNYRAERFSTVISLGFGESEFDARNPIYGEYQDADWSGLEATLYVPLSPQLSLIFVGTIVEDDADIQFHDQKVTAIVAGVYYTFGAP